MPKSKPTKSTAKSGGKSTAKSTSQSSKQPSRSSKDKARSVKAASATAIVANSKQKRQAESESESESESEDEEETNNNPDAGKGGASDSSDDSGDEDKRKPYRSKNGKWVYIPNKGDLEYTRWGILTKPEDEDGKKKTKINLAVEMELDGNPQDHRLFLRIRDFVRSTTLTTVTNWTAVWNDIDTDTRNLINAKCRAMHHYLWRFKGSWATEEIARRALCNRRDTDSRIEKESSEHTDTISAQSYFTWVVSVSRRIDACSSTRRWDASRRVVGCTGQARKAHLAADPPFLLKRAVALDANDEYAQSFRAS
ncbi:hypothetical protein FRC09_007780 [Ceratobasidium sp. 395]|nr:hypothetical protein FRC09_007780 [Ceratobasidium sp. 395]